MAALDYKPNFRGYGAGWSKKFLSDDHLGDHMMSKKIISNAAVVSNDFKAQCDMCQPRGKKLFQVNHKKHHEGRSFTFTVLLLGFTQYLLLRQ